MNKKQLNDLIPLAEQVLKDSSIANVKGQISKEYRGQISSFGSAAATGSLLAAVTFFSDKGDCKVDRQKLMEAINTLLRKGKLCETENDLFHTVCRHSGTMAEKAAIKDQVMTCALALKLAMNLFKLV